LPLTRNSHLCNSRRPPTPHPQPKFLLTIIPGYPLLNFAICTALYVYISHRLFLLTNALKDALVPHDNNRVLGRNIILMGATLVGCTAMGFVGHTAGMIWLQS